MPAQGSLTGLAVVLDWNIDDGLNFGVSDV